MTTPRLSPSGPDNPIFQPGDFTLWDDMLSGAPRGIWTPSVAGAGAATAAVVSADANRPGIRSISTGTTATGRTSLNYFRGAIVLGANVVTEWTTDVRLPILPTAAQDFRFQTGLAGNFALATLQILNGAIFVADLSSPFWQIVTARGGVRIAQLTAVPLVDNEWVRLRVDTFGTSRAVFSINGSEVGTLPDLPVTTTGGLAHGWKIQKTVGVTARLAHFDFGRFRRVSSEAR